MITKRAFVFATAIILCHLASRSAFDQQMTRRLKEIIEPIISFHYEMKLSWKRMRKFHTLEIRFCKVLCPRPWVQAHQKPFSSAPAEPFSSDERRQRSATDSEVSGGERGVPHLLMKWFLSVAQHGRRLHLSIAVKIAGVMITAVFLKCFYVHIFTLTSTLNWYIIIKLLLLLS